MVVVVRDGNGYGFFFFLVADLWRDIFIYGWSFNVCTKQCNPGVF